jgi:hypothetical protein
MKLLTKLSLSAATLMAIGTSAAFADDQHLQNQLALERAQNSPRAQQTTIAVYAGRHGFSQRNAMQDERSDTPFELRSNAHGQVIGAHVPAK